jgi:tripartite-type tricarboxylate transporter receptor subunit TctC
VPVKVLGIAGVSRKMRVSASHSRAVAGVSRKMRALVYLARVSMSLKLSGVLGTAGHLSGELFKMMAGVNIVHVPYRGEALALTDLLGGQVQVMFATMPASIEYIKAGKLRSLALTSATRLDALPNVPSVGDLLTGYEASAWQGVGAPKNTPAEIIAKLNEEINAGLADPKLKARLADLGGTVIAGSPADFGKLIAEETEKWGKVVRAANIKA